MARVLVLTASYGSGHNAAARAIAAALASEGAEVIVADHFREHVHPLFDRLSRALYLRVLRRAPALWGAAYALADWMAPDSPLALGLTRAGTSALGRRLVRDPVDAIVTVHATPAAALSALAATSAHRRFHVNVITDFVAHSQWIARLADLHCVATDEVRHSLMARGVPGARIRVTGMPVHPAFESMPVADRARATLGVPRDAPLVLAMAGSHGALGRLDVITDVLLRSPRRPHAVLVSGHDADVERMLHRRTAGTRVRVRGHVADVRPLMAAADLLVTKAGGMTLAEAFAAGVPLLLFGSLPGQERQNAAFAARAGVALVARSRPDLHRLLECALGDPSLLDGIRARQRALARPAAARDIAGTVLAAARSR